VGVGSLARVLGIAQPSVFGRGRAYPPSGFLAVEALTQVNRFVLRSRTSTDHPRIQVNIEARKSTRSINWRAAEIRPVVPLLLGRGARCRDAQAGCKH